MCLNGFESVSENIAMYRSGAKSSMCYEKKDFDAQAEVMTTS